MDALENLVEDDVLILHCHENGDCQEPDDRHSERSHVGSELPDQLIISNQTSHVSRLCVLQGCRLGVCALLFVKTARLPRDSRPQVQSLRRKKGGGLLLHSHSRQLLLLRNEDTSDTLVTNTLSEASSDTLTQARVGGGKNAKVVSEPKHQHQC